MREKLIKIFEDINCPAHWLFPNNAEMLKLADYLIANGVTVQKWIPASDPPKEKGCYLVSANYWYDGKHVSREAFWNGADWLSCYDKFKITQRITHWMPLPEPQKAGDI